MCVHWRRQRLALQPRPVKALKPGRCLHLRERQPRCTVLPQQPCQQLTQLLHRTAQHTVTGQLALTFPHVALTFPLVQGAGLGASSRGEHAVRHMTRAAPARSGQGIADAGAPRGGPQAAPAPAARPATLHCCPRAAAAAGRSTPMAADCQPPSATASHPGTTCARRPDSAASDTHIDQAGSPPPASVRPADVDSHVNRVAVATATFTTAPCRNLGRHVRCGPTARVCAVRALRQRHTAAQVCKLQVAVTRQQQVAGLDVPAGATATATSATAVARLRLAWTQRAHRLPAS